MQLISPPMRDDDLINSRAAISQRLEELSFLDRIALSNIEPFPWGFCLRPTLSPRFRAWWKKQESITQHLWIDSVELDSLGSLFLICRDPFGLCAAICSWRYVTAAIDHLRRKCIGPVLWNTYQTGLMKRLVEELAPVFGLEPRPVNSLQLPCYAAIEWGLLVQLKADQIAQLLDYFSLEASTDSALPTLVKLGSNISAVLAFGPLSARIGLCWNGLEDPTLLDLQGWLASAHKSVT